LSGFESVETLLLQIRGEPERKIAIAASGRLLAEVRLSNASVPAGAVVRLLRTAAPAAHASPRVAPQTPLSCQCKDGICRLQVPRLQEAAAAPAWGRLLQAALALLAQAANGSAAPEDDVLDVEEFAGGTTQQGPVYIHKYLIPALTE
jgi:hypothetical protein